VLCLLFISFNLLRIRRAFGFTVIYENGVELGSQTLLWCEVMCGYFRKHDSDADLVLMIPAPWPIGAIPLDESVWDCTIPVAADDKETITKLPANGEVLPPKHLAQLN
jgi:hypothetical protein